MEIADRIKFLIKEKGFTPVSFAESLGIPNVTVYRWINGKSKPQFDHLQKICTEFDVNPTWLLTGMSEVTKVALLPKSSRIIPVYNSISDVIDSTSPSNHLSISDDDIFAAMIVDTDTMTPTIMKNDACLLVLPVNVRINQIVIARYQNEHIIRRIVSNDSTVVLIADNPEFRPITADDRDVKILAVVKTIRRSLF